MTEAETTDDVPAGATEAHLQSCCKVAAIVHIQPTTRTAGRPLNHASAGAPGMQVIRQAGTDELLALWGATPSCRTSNVYLNPQELDATPPLAIAGNLLEGSLHRSFVRACLTRSR